MRLSYSNISTMLRCPRSWKFKYIDKVPVPSSGPLVLGQSYHKALAWAFGFKMSGENPPLSDILAVYNTSFDRQANLETVSEDGEIINAVEWGDEDPEQVKEDGAELVKLYMDEVFPRIEPVSIEQRIETEIDGIPLIGYVDLFTPDLIIDHKTVKRKMGDNEAHKDLQMSIYALILNKPFEMQFHQAIRGRNPRIEIIETERTEKDIQWTRSLVKEVWGSIQSGYFPPNPTSYLCGDGVCPYHDLCYLSEKLKDEMPEDF